MESDRKYRLIWHLDTSQTLGQKRHILNTSLEQLSQTCSWEPTVPTLCLKSVCDENFNFPNRVAKAFVVGGAWFQFFWVMHPEIRTKFWRIRCGESRSNARARRCPWFAWCKSLLEIMYWKQSTLYWAVFKTPGGWWLWGILRGIEGLISAYINVQLHHTHWAIENIPWRRLKASCCRRLVCAQIVSFEIENLANVDAVVNACCPWNRRLKFAGPQVWILIVIVSSANPSNQSNYPSPSWRCWMSFANPKMVWSLWSQHHRGPKMWKNNSSEMGMDQNLWNHIFWGSHVPSSP